MSLGNEQRKFSLMVAKLITHAYEIGYEITLGDAFRDPRLHGKMGEKKAYGHTHSCHKVKLAIDLNLFKDGRYITDSTGHDELHDYWDSIGGGRRIKHDANHYSIEWQGHR